MKNLVAFTNISCDDEWKSTAYELKDNLKRFDIDLVINISDADRANNVTDLQKQYSIRDSAFLAFARSENRRILYLDAEVRMHQTLPPAWHDDVTVVFYVQGRDIRCTGADGCLYKFPINTGQGIWNKQGVSAYEKAVDACLENINGLGFYDEEAYIADYLDFDHIKSKIAMNRIQDKGCEATRGFWLTDKTIFTHPYLHNVKNYDMASNNMGIPTMTSEYFLAHFCPEDLSVAKSLLDFMLKYGIVDQLPFEPETAFSLATNPPANIPSGLSRRSDPCYVIKDWIFCPTLSLLAPSNIWSKSSWNMIGN